MGSILRPIENLIGFLVGEIYNFIPSVGVSIILVTMLVMLLIFPLTHKQTKSMLSMQMLQPQIKALQEKYKDDRQKLSEETMKLYKESGVNPLGGCLPLVIQMPFFFSMFRVTRNLQDYVGEDTKLFKAICAPAKTLKVCTGNAGTLSDAGFSFDKGYNPETLAEKLPVSKNFLGLHLSDSLIHAVKQNFGLMSIIAYLVLTLLVAVASYIAISRSQNLNPNTANQPAFTKYFKYFIPLMAATSPIYLPAGASLYLLTSSAWRACQQEYLYKKIIIPHHEKQKNGDAAKIEVADKSSTSDGPVIEGGYEAGKARAKRKKK